MTAVDFAALLHRERKRAIAAAAKSSLHSSSIFSLDDVRAIDLSEYRLRCAIDSLFYIPNFISKKESASLLTNLKSPKHDHWTKLSNRRLQNWGGVPHPRLLLVRLFVCLLVHLFVCFVCLFVVFVVVFFFFRFFYPVCHLFVCCSYACVSVLSLDVLWACIRLFVSCMCVCGECQCS